MLKGLIQFLKCHLNFNNHFFYNFQSIESTNDRIILAPTNEMADKINSLATNLMPGDAVIITSYDKLIEDSQQAQYPTEFLNTLNISGLPPHILYLKVGLPIILIRNINPATGL